MIRRLVERLRAIWGVPDRMRKLARMYEELGERIGERTTVHCDVHWKGESNVIVVGRYRRRDYVRCFTVDAQAFDVLIRKLEKEERYACVGRFDLPGMYPDVSAVYPCDRLK